jgi:hypothetical protein
MVQLSAISWSCIAILRVSLVRFATITACVASGRVFIVVSVYFVIDSVRKLLDTPSYNQVSCLCRVKVRATWARSAVLMLNLQHCGFRILK